MDLIYRYDPYQPVAAATPETCADAVEILREGNDRFVNIVDLMQRATLGEKVNDTIIVPVSPLSMGLPLWSGGAVTQAPFGLVLGCSDARVPLEQIFDQAFNSLFVVRVAGNVLGTECVGSIDYAVRQFGTSLRFVTVLGHSSCGAVSAAVDTYLSLDAYGDIASTYALRSLVDRLLFAVRGAANAIKQVGPTDKFENGHYRRLLIETTVYLNAAITAFDLRRELRSIDAAKLSVLFGVYDLESHHVCGCPCEPSRTQNLDRPPLLAAAPQRAEDFSELAESLARNVIAKYSQQSQNAANSA
jgi:carbonic anhydrase